MAQVSGFFRFLETIGVVQRVDKGEETSRPRETASRPRTVGKKSSVYEDNYTRSRNFSGNRRPAASSSASRENAVVKKNAIPQIRPDTVVYYMGSLGECADVIRAVLDGTSVVINFDGTDDRMSQRIIDTLSGAAFALNAKVRKITDSTYIIAPASSNINITERVSRRY